MRKITIILIFGLVLLGADAFCQKGQTRYFGEPILTDSLSTLFIPVKYSGDFLTSNKISLGGEYYANILAYNFVTDTYKKIFDKDTFIESLRENSYSYYVRPNTQKSKNLTSKWFFVSVKTKDTNDNGRIDERDPSVLFAVSLDGHTLKQLTYETENVVSFENFEKQGFILIKIQRDLDNDKSFRTEDKDFYFQKVSLTDLTLGKNIEAL